MGETSVDTKREIESVRDDISATVGELERRAKSLLDLKAQAEQHPAAVGAVGFGVLAGLLVIGYNAVADYRESRRPVNRLKRRAGGLRDEVEERWSRARDSMPYGVYVGRNPQEAETGPSNPGMVKSLLWMGLSAGSVALFGLLARRASAQVWQLVMREPPPTQKA
jgi:hypothetical protein